MLRAKAFGSAQAQFCGVHVLSPLRYCDRSSQFTPCGHFCHVHAPRGAYGTVLWHYGGADKLTYDGLSLLLASANLRPISETFLSRDAHNPQLLTLNLGGLKFVSNSQRPNRAMNHTKAEVLAVN